MDSRADKRIQAADIAAGLARHVLGQEGLVGLIRRWAKVYYNGSRLTQNNLEPGTSVLVSGRPAVERLKRSDFNAQRASRPPHLGRVVVSESRDRDLDGFAAAEYQQALRGDLL